jgi:purine nucleosidase
LNAIHHVVLDTDIGSDVDDALALALILGLPSIELVGVTTVYGDTTLRARLAQRYAGLAGVKLTVIPGLERPLSGKEVWWPGHEGTLHPNLEAEPIETRVSAAGFLQNMATKYAGELNVIAIGPLTNIAEAIQDDPAFAHNVGQLWIMGGAFDRAETEHNFRSDDIAARIVFDSGMKITVLPLDVTEKLRVTHEQVTSIGAAGPLGKALLADIEQWWNYWGIEWNVPHDPLTVLALVQPDLFTFSLSGVVRIATGGENAGASEFIEDSVGTVRIATDVDPSRATESMLEGITHSGLSTHAGLP